ncbi:MAG: hypothetical protein RR768_10770 [Clostridium sp.]
MKRSFKSLLSYLVCTSLIFTQTASLYTTTAYAAEDFTDVFTGLDSVVNQLLNFGLDIDEIETLLSLTPKESLFYSKKAIESPYDGDFVIMNADYPEVRQSFAISDYDGNPPKSVADQQVRFTNIYNVATKNYKTFRYEGPKNTIEDFGDYMFYLYLSNYIDGPFRAPTANDLPEVISLQDIQAYERFLQGTSMANAGQKISEFAMTLYSVPDAKDSILNLAHGLDTTIWQYTNDAYTIYSTVDGGTNIANAAMPYIIDKFDKDYETALSEAEFAATTEDYVMDKLNELADMNDYTSSSKEIIVSTVIGTFLPIAAGTFSIMGIYVAAVPAFTYIFVTLFEVLNILNLTQTFNGRYIRRAEIEYDF